MIGILLFAILVCLVAFWYSIKDLLPFYCLPVSRSFYSTFSNLLKNSRDDFPLPQAGH